MPRGAQLGAGRIPHDASRTSACGSPGQARAALAKSRARAPRRATPRIRGKGKERKTGEPPRPSKATGTNPARLFGCLTSEQDRVRPDILSAVVPAQAGTHNPRPIESARRMGPRLRGDDTERRRARHMEIASQGQRICSVTAFAATNSSGSALTAALFLGLATEGQAKTVGRAAVVKLEIEYPAPAVRIVIDNVSVEPERCLRIANGSRGSDRHLRNVDIGYRRARRGRADGRLDRQRRRNAVGALLGQ